MWFWYPYQFYFVIYTICHALHIPLCHTDSNYLYNIFPRSFYVSSFYPSLPPFRAPVLSLISRFRVHSLHSWTLAGTLEISCVPESSPTVYPFSLAEERIYPRFIVCLERNTPIYPINIYTETCVCDAQEDIQIVIDGKPVYPLRVSSVVIFFCVTNPCFKANIFNKPFLFQRVWSTWLNNKGNPNPIPEI